VVETATARDNLAPVSKEEGDGESRPLFFTDKNVSKSAQSFRMASVSFYRRYALIPLLVLFTLNGEAFAADSVEFVQRSLPSGGKQRQYLVYKPPHRSPQPQPLLIAFHGARGTAEGFEKISHLGKVAKREGFVLVYPDAFEKHWNDGRKEIAPGVDDIAFVDALLESLAREFNTDSKRTYATGFSNGGLFSYRLACERPGKFAAVAPVGANMGLALSKTCKPALPTPLLSIVGDKDPLMPFNGGRLTGPFGAGNHGLALSAEETLAFWVAQNKCKDAKPATRKGAVGQDGTSADRTVYAQCAGGSNVAQFVVREGGHTWPGGWQYLRQWIIGKTSQELDASQAVWDFVSQYHR
jgi:polyhydroxybutyrate depolymerase